MPPLTYCPAFVSPARYHYRQRRGSGKYVWSVICMRTFRREAASRQRNIYVTTADSVGAACLASKKAPRSAFNLGRRSEARHSGISSSPAEPYRTREEKQP